MQHSIPEFIKLKIGIIAESESGKASDNESIAVLYQLWLHSKIHVINFE